MISFPLQKASIIAILLADAPTQTKALRGRAKPGSENEATPTKHRELSETNAHPQQISQWLDFLDGAFPQQNIDEITRNRPPTSDDLQLSNHEFNTRIVGGSPASPTDYPFFVAWEGCGASLIHDDIILTAAHCNPIRSNSVRVSAHRLYGGGETKRIVQRVPHPQYNDFSTAYDFMILKLSSPANAQPVALNRNSFQPRDNKELTVVGLGTTREGGNSATVLQEVTVPTVSHSTCNRQYRGSIKQDVMLCAGYTEGGKDSCQGDSGGPILEFENGKAVQVGVVSFGEGCARPNRAGVYARVSGVNDWIDEQICALSANPPNSCGSSPSLEESESTEDDDEEHWLVAWWNNWWN